MSESAPNPNTENRPKRWGPRAILTALGIGIIGMLPHGDKPKADTDGDKGKSGIENFEANTDIESHIEYTKSSIQSIETDPTKPGVKILEFNISGTTQSVELPANEADEIINSGTVEIAFTTDEEGNIVILQITPPGKAKQLIQQLLRHTNPPGYYETVGGDEKNPKPENSPGYYRVIGGPDEEKPKNSDGYYETVGDDKPKENSPGYYEKK